MKATGTNTAAIIKVMAMTAPAISLSTFFTAVVGEQFSSAIFAWTASTTTIALSTTTPIANTSANRVIRLMLMLKNFRNMNVPINDTGTARVGINVERQSPRNRNTTRATSTKASPRVCTTFSIEASRNAETS